MYVRTRAYVCVCVRVRVLAPRRHDMDHRDVSGLNMRLGLHTHFEVLNRVCSRAFPSRLQKVGTLR